MKQGEKVNSFLGGLLVGIGIIIFLAGAGVGCGDSGRRQSILPRWVHACWANAGYYFWLPCQRCGDMAGGHEWDGTAIERADKPGTYKGVCPACSREANVHVVDGSRNFTWEGKTWSRGRRS